METGAVLFFSLIVIYTIVAYILGRVSITMPMFFVIAGAIVGSDGFGLVSFTWDAAEVERLAEITLALLLFSDAATLDFGKVRDDVSLPGRLLLVAFPLIILTGGICGYLLFPEEKIGFALLLGAILAPTDAALGLPIFNNPRVPVRIRRALNVESGLNDGLATPMVTLFIALTIEELSHVGGAQNWILIALSEIGIAVLVGALLGLISGWLFSQAVEKNWTSEVARQIGNPAIALLVFFGSKAVGGNGFVAVFIAGILFAYITRHILHDAIEFTEIAGSFFSLFVWTIFGSIIVLKLFLNFNPSALFYGILSLTVVRLIPVAIAMIGTRMRKDTILMMGWLGPRGLASVVFLVMAYEAAEKAHVEVGLLTSIVGWTIFLSVLLHGASALPLANWYGKRLDVADPEIPEKVETPELRNLRHRAFYPRLPKNTESRVEYHR